MKHETTKEKRNEVIKYYAITAVLEIHTRLLSHVCDISEMLYKKIAS